jgi:hypothetical protein
MKKSIIISIVTASLMFFAGLAEAGNRGHHKGHYSKHSYSSSRHYGYRPQPYRNRGYGYYGHHGSNHHYEDGLKIAAGVFILGSIIHAANNSHQERVVVGRRSVPTTRSNRWFQLDNEGQCVEVTENSQGQEVWTYVDQSYCN